MNDTIETKSARAEARVNDMPRKLNKALECDDKLKAIRMAHQHMEDDSEDEEIEALYLFLLERVGVPVREPFFTLSMQPFVRTMPAIAMSVPLLMLAGNYFSLDEKENLRTADVLSTFAAAVVLGVPVFYILF